MLQNMLVSWDELKGGVKFYVDSKSFKPLIFFFLEKGCQDVNGQHC